MQAIMNRPFQFWRRRMEGRTDRPTRHACAGRLDPDSEQQQALCDSNGRWQSSVDWRRSRWRMTAEQWAREGMGDTTSGAVAE